MLFVCGRVLVYCHDGAHVCDVDTGAILATFPKLRLGDGIVVDRFACATKPGALLVDCATLQLVEMPSQQRFYSFSACGQCVAYWPELETLVTFVRIDMGADNMASVMLVRSFSLLREVDLLQLCRRGRLYLLFDSLKNALNLCDTVSGAVIRTFSARANALFVSVVFSNRVCSVRRSNLGHESSSRQRFYARVADEQHK